MEICGVKSVVTAWRKPSAFFWIATEPDRAGRLPVDPAEVVLITTISDVRRANADGEVGRRPPVRGWTGVLRLAAFEGGWSVSTDVAAGAEIDAVYACRTRPRPQAVPKFPFRKPRRAMGCAQSATGPEPKPYRETVHRIWRRQGTDFPAGFWFPKGTARATRMRRRRSRTLVSR